MPELVLHALFVPRRQNKSQMIKKNKSRKTKEKKEQTKEAWDLGHEPSPLHL